MEVIKRKILLEDSIDRNYNSQTWGLVTATTFYLNIQLNQTIDDIGLFTDVMFISKNKKNVVDYSILIEKLENEGYSFPFMNGVSPINFTSSLTSVDKLILRLPEKILSQYYIYGNNPLTGFTDSKINDVRSYKKNEPYILNFNIKTESYQNYLGTTINGVNRVTSIGEPMVYVFDATSDLNIGTLNQITGIQYGDYSGLTSTILNANGVDFPSTSFRFITEGWNQTNTSLSALQKEEFLLGIISRPEVENDVFIDRGITPVLDYHLRLSEIKNLGQLQQYGNGYYRIDTI